MKATKKEQKAFRIQLLNSQNQLCAWCLRGKYKSQTVNTLDHNHSCCLKWEGCRSCARGMVHAYCNRALHIVEVNPHLQNEFSKLYLAKGKK